MNGKLCPDNLQVSSTIMARAATSERERGKESPSPRELSCPRMRPRTLRSPRLLRRETPRKRCPGGREDARGAVCYISQLQWLGHVLRMPEHRLVRQVLLNCVKLTHETLFADEPNLSIENATKMSKDRKLWSSNRPSLRCQPLSGGVAIK